MPKNTATPPLADALARARALSSDMTAATEALNRSLSEAEQAIADLKLGVTAKVLMEESDNSPYCAFLVFGKHENAWRLLLESGWDPNLETMPLAKASRGTRVMAADFLGLLVEQLIKVAGEELENIKAKTEVVRDVTNQIYDGVPF